MKRFMKRHLFEIIIAVAVIFVLCTCFFNLHEYATAWRGYNAIGGEIFVFALPLIAYVVYRKIKDR